MLKPYMIDDWYTTQIYTNQLSFSKMTWPSLIYNLLNHGISSRDFIFLVGRMIFYWMFLSNCVKCSGCKNAHYCCWGVCRPLVATEASNYSFFFLIYRSSIYNLEGCCFTTLLLLGTMMLCITISGS